MKLNPFSGPAMLPVALCLFFFAYGQAAAQTPSRPSAPRVLHTGGADAFAAAATRRLPKRAVMLRTNTAAPDASRVTILSDSALDDCTAYAEDKRFYVRIPWAAVRSSQLPAEGRGFTDARVEQRDEAVLITFDLRAGTSASIARGFNRVEITFAATPTPAADGRRTTDEQQGVVTARATVAEPSNEAESLRLMRAQIAELEARVRELEARQPSPPPASETARAATDAAPVAPAGHTAATHAEPAVAQSGSAVDAEDHHGPPKLEIRGFADVNLRASNAKGSTTSFALGQLDLFITSRLSEKFSVLSELIIEANERNQFSFEIHRLLLQYSPNDNLQLSAGRYHAGIGYYNTAYHHGSWFQTAANRPFIFAFEGKGGILPLHNVGVAATGRVPRAPFGLRYVAEVGNGRASRTPLEAPVQTTVDENNRKAVNLGLFVRPPKTPGLQAGFSVYRDRLTPLNAPHIGQTITAGYVAFQNARYESLNEMVLMRLTSGGRVFYTPAFYTQFARQFGSLRPFVRYQYVNVPSDNPIFTDVGRRNGPAVGVRYDLTDFAAFKAQYERTSRRRLGALDELILQLAFTF